MMSGIVNVYYADTMVAESESFSPSAGKPAAVIKSWQRLFIDIQIVAPDAVTIDQLARAHDRAFVEGVLACRKKNGFGNRSRAVAASLPSRASMTAGEERRWIAGGIASVRA